MANTQPRKNQLTEAQLGNWLIHSLSPYNDGWTQELYRKLYEDGLKKIERRKKREAKKNQSQKPQA